MFPVRADLIWEGVRTKENRKLYTLLSIAKCRENMKMYPYFYKSEFCKSHNGKFTLTDP